MGNEHVTDKQLKNDVFTAFAVQQELMKLFICDIWKPTNIVFVGF